jgi:hypothetical protein
VFAAVPPSSLNTKQTIGGFITKPLFTKLFYLMQSTFSILD